MVAADWRRRDGDIGIKSLLSNFCPDFGQTRSSPKTNRLLPEIKFPAIQFPASSVRKSSATYFRNLILIRLLALKLHLPCSILGMPMKVRFLGAKRDFYMAPPPNFLRGKIVFPRHNHSDLWPRGRFDHSTTIIWISIVS